MKSLKEVDWSKAPEGATHYNAACDCPWLKETPASYFVEGMNVWAKYRLDCSNHFINAVKRPQEWDGGVPPVGTVCEYLWSEGKEWRKCEIVAYYFANVVAVDVDSTAVCLPTGLFRPIKTPEQIAAEERLLAIDEMCNVIRESDLKTVAALYDAGYRKIEAKK